VVGELESTQGEPIASGTAGISFSGDRKVDADGCIDNVYTTANNPFSSQINLSGVAICCSGPMTFRKEPAMATDSVPRETIINLRAPSAQRALIDQAAQVQGKSRTDFMLEAAYEKAQQVLLDRTVFALDAKRFERFAEILDAPVKTNKALNRLLAKRAPWER
jgi:uncharacterized protein (DUF1778 family)